MHIIEVTDLWKGFRVRGKPVEAVKGINFSVEKGDIFGLLGPNGAGKTTTLRLLATLLLPDKGQARIAGFDLVSQAARVREQIGYVGQHGGADIQASGHNNILLQAQAYGLDRQRARQRTQELLDLLELAECSERPVRTYSGGQRRRLDLALGIVHQPQLLFLDEPSAGLDSQSRAHLWEEVRKLHAAGTSVFLTTHYLEEADALCKRLAIVDKGTIVAEGTPTELKQQIAGDVITLKLASEPELLSRARQLLQIQPFVRELQQEKETLQVYVENGAEKLASVVRLLESAQIPVQSIALARPSLDDVFLRQTGRALRA